MRRRFHNLPARLCGRWKRLYGRCDRAVIRCKASSSISRTLPTSCLKATARIAASFLLRNHISLRVFVLVGLPVRKEEWADATRMSIEASFRSGAEVVSLIPTRLGNGAMEELQRQGQFQPPTFEDLEMALEDFLEGEEGNARSSGLVLADLWNADALGAPSRS